MCCFSLKNSLSQVFALLQRYFCRRHCFYASLSFSPSKQNLNSSGLCFYSKKSWKWDIWNAHEENLKQELLFLQICLCAMSQFTFFEELGCQRCIPGRFWTWSVSLWHPVLLTQPQRWNTRARTIVMLGEGQQKAVKFCIQTWISLRGWIPLFLFKFHLQLISSVYA